MNEEEKVEIAWINIIRVLPTKTETESWRKIVEEAVAVPVGNESLLHNPW